MKRSATPQSNRTLAIVLGGVALGAFLLVVIVALVLAANRGGSGVAVAAIPTVAALPSPTVEPTQIAVALLEQELPSPTASPSPAATEPPAGRLTLPPTWTISPTPSRTPTPTLTPTIPPATAFPTLSSQQLANTYWEGDGQHSMWDVQFPDGSFARFTILPVNLWVGAYGNVQITAEHDAAIDNAIRQISQVVPIQRVQNRAFAHITMWLMTDDEFNRNAGCNYIDMTVGCTSSMFTDVGILLNSVWMRVSDECFADTVLHELTHALGILVHSPSPSDIMYYMQTCGGPQYSQRDLNTLRALYAAPPYDPRHQ